MAVSYKQAFSDWSYLWNEYGPADDMTGGYVDQDDLASLLRNPSKTTARDCLVRQIGYWFQVGPDYMSRQPASVWDPHQEDVLAPFRELYNKFGGKTYALTIDGDVLVLQ